VGTSQSGAEYACLEGCEGCRCGKVRYGEASTLPNVRRLSRVRGGGGGEARAEKDGKVKRGGTVGQKKVGAERRWRGGEVERRGVGGWAVGSCGSSMTAGCFALWHHASRPQHARQCNVCHDRWHTKALANHSTAPLGTPEPSAASCVAHTHCTWFCSILKSHSGKPDATLTIVLVLQDT
jgi:hypothetical protein